MHAGQSGHQPSFSSSPIRHESNRLAMRTMGSLVKLSTVAAPFISYAAMIFDEDFLNNASRVAVDLDVFSVVRKFDDARVLVEDHASRYV